MIKLAYQDVFKRVEKKYLIDEEKYNQLFDRIKDYITPDRYGESTICNIYYDTPDHRLIRRSLEKPVYKEKFRVRSYGVPTMEDEVFVELKKKFKGVVFDACSDKGFYRPWKAVWKSSSD